MLSLLLIMLMVLMLDMAIEHTPPIRRMFMAEKPYLTQEYLDHEEFLRLNRDQSLEWWVGVTD